MKSKILSIMTVKNEYDIVEDVIVSALKWSDYIIIMDNNSDDGTWDIVKKLSDRHERVLLWGRYYGKFKDSIRRMYQDFKYLARAGDWWCRLDADEFYIDNPRDFIDKIDLNNDYICSASSQYYLTEIDFDRGVKSYKELEGFKCNWGETRFFKEKNNINWPESQGWPINLFSRSESFIRLRHYQYRNSNQIKNRYKVRLNNTVNNSEFKHEISSSGEWYINKGFSVPEDPLLLENRIVSLNDLDVGDNFDIPDEFKRKFRLTKKIKIAKYIKYFFSFYFYKMPR
ncbi:glycosyltransferase [Tatumella sp. TA1]|nr:glycosyltransferase [Tatumella sp. TA1]